MGRMASPPRLPPPLNDDVTTEILLRIAPHDPARLFRATLVCKLWLRIVSDPDFSSRYREFHKLGALLLGFFYNRAFPGPFSGFVSTTAASTLAGFHDRRVSWVLDCRHGRVLFKKTGSKGGLIVWDPVADHWNDLPAPDHYYSSYSAVVLCDVAGCDHGDCHGGPFLVVCLGVGLGSRDIPHDQAVVHTCVYSSEDGGWRTPVTSNLYRACFDVKRPAIVGDAIYCSINRGARGLKYDLVNHSFSTFGMPYIYRRDPVLMQNEDGSLGLAGVDQGSTLYLWSKDPEEATAGWVQRRVIELRNMLPVDNPSCISANVIGFAEGVGVLFLSTNVGVFTVELNSGRVVKAVSTTSKNYRSAFPFVSFFTPDCAGSKLPMAVERN